MPLLASFKSTTTVIVLSVSVEYISCNLAIFRHTLKYIYEAKRVETASKHATFDTYGTTIQQRGIDTWWRNCPTRLCWNCFLPGSDDSFRKCSKLTHSDAQVSAVMCLSAVTHAGLSSKSSENKSMSWRKEKTRGGHKLFLVSSWKSHVKPSKCWWKKKMKPWSLFFRHQQTFLSSSWFWTTPPGSREATAARVSVLVTWCLLIPVI